MRGPLLLRLLACGTLAVAAQAIAGPSLDVRSVLPSTDRARLTPAAAAGKRVIDPATMAAQARRERRWRSFPDHMGPKGFDWSPAARRRSRTPAWMHRDRRIGTESVAGVPDSAVIRVAFIRIDFRNDRDGDRSSGNGRFDLSGPDTLVPPIDRPPHNREFYGAHLEALSRYYHAQSYGRTRVQGEVWPSAQNGAYSLSDMADLGPWEFSQDIYGAALHMFRTMVMAADSQSTRLGDRIPWETYDRIVLIHAGSDLQSDVRQDSPLDIPSFTIGVADSDAVIFPDDSLALSKVIANAAVVPETATQDGFYGAINGVLAHECGHLFFGFADLYNVETGLPVVGYWSLMDSGNLVGSIVVLPDSTELFASGLLPPSIDPWQRQFATDALLFPELAYGAETPLRNGERHPEMRRVTLSSDEYLLLENRYLAPADSVQLDQDSTTRVVLGPKNPDRYEYDALLPGGGILVWHVDESVIPLHETTYPCDTARANYKCGFNTNFFRLAISVVEADGLADLGDLGSPYLLGGPFDPYFVGNNTTLSDTTKPNLIPHIGTRPHVRLDVLDVADSTMRVRGLRTWQLAASPFAGDFPPGGPKLLAIDADGDRNLEVCWAGGAADSSDSTALFAIRFDGQGLAGASPVFARLNWPPRPEMAAIATGEFGLTGPSLFAVSTRFADSDTASAAGRVWLLNHLGAALPGWPAVLPARVTTPPILTGVFPSVHVYVGCDDGHVYDIGMDGAVIASSSPALAGGIRGQLAGWRGLGTGSAARIAAGGGNGEIATFQTGTMTVIPGWPRSLGVSPLAPDFLWITGLVPYNSVECGPTAPNLIVHHADRLWGFCFDGTPLPGWGRSFGDTLVAGLGAGDPDGDGFAEVLTQTVRSQLLFVNRTGYPSPGWPRPGSREAFRTGSPPLALDVDGDGRSEVIGLNASGIIAAIGLAPKAPPGWPLATGLGAIGSPVIADLNRDGTLELVAPDRDSRLYAYGLPVPTTKLLEPSWTMLGGDPQRTFELTIDEAPTPPAASPGPLIGGSFKAYPNPARRSPVSFAYQLTEPAEVDFRIVDTSGHEVAAFSRQGRQSDNIEVWDPGALPAGLYLAHVRFRGAGSERVEVVPVGVLR